MAIGLGCHHFLLAHLLGNDGDAVPLLGKAGGALGDEVAAALRDERFRGAVGAFEMVNVADGLAAFHFRAEVEADLEDAGFGGEEVIFAVERLREDDGRQAEAFARLFAALERRGG
jgi:hypothetical protein